MRRLTAPLLILFLILFSSAALAAHNPIPGDIRIVIGSKSIGADTHMNASIVANALAEKLGVKVTVAAVGYKAAYDELSKTGEDGTTLMIYHDQFYLAPLYKIKGFENTDMFKKFKIGPMVSINPGNVYLVPKNTPYWSIYDVIDACGTGAKIRVAVKEGSTSEIGYTALKHAIKIRYPGQENNLIKVPTGSQKSKDEAMFDGKADLINGTIQANASYTQLPVYDNHAMRVIWLTARAQTIDQANPEGYSKISRNDLLELAEPYSWVPFNLGSNFTFDKEFFFIYNKNIKPEVAKYLDQTIAAIYQEGQVEEVLKKNFFIPNFKPSSQAEAYLMKKNERIKKIFKELN